MNLHRCFVSQLSLLLLLTATNFACAQSKGLRVIAFNPDTNAYQELLSGNQDSVMFYSGVVCLLPGETGELHSTESYEEMIIPLQGQGMLTSGTGESLILKTGTVAYVPCLTVHQLHNNGKTTFRYVYIAARRDGDGKNHKH